MKFAITFIAAFLFLVGCSTSPKSNVGDPPVRYARYVRAAVFDSTPRQPTSAVKIIRETPTQKFHIVASLNIDGDPPKEGMLINALAWKARQLGVDAILILPPLQVHKDEWSFRADAIVMDLEK